MVAFWLTITSAAPHNAISARGSWRVVSLRDGRLCANRRDSSHMTAAGAAKNAMVADAASV